MIRSPDQAVPGWYQNLIVARLGTEPAAEWRTEPRWRPYCLDTPPTAFVVVIRTHYRRPTNAGQGAQRDGYWCGPPAPDRTVGWLQRRDPVTRVWTATDTVAAFPSAWDATLAWTRHVAASRRAGRPVGGYVQYLPLVAIPDLGGVPPRPYRPRRYDWLAPRLDVPTMPLIERLTAAVIPW